jgi:hypothetical protein
MLKVSHTPESSSKEAKSIPFICNFIDRKFVAAVAGGSFNKFSAVNAQ